ncbi:YdgH/BhsA/McbA-like domain containing protein [Erwinia sp. 9145]|uniref:YdgH/BhsA/McbA-like domain containing protein n=1 Tax=Erwinia sp. 9145 TaxID=1500895 RepID=UPI00054E702B|nr:YdgH/BhsA/McbA-like domain containing protein [Erwinia sp. 9145]
MNMKLPALFAAAVLAATSFSALAATQVDQDQSQNLQAAGTVTISNVNGSLDDANRQLKAKAEEMGASHYRIIRAETPGDSSLWSGTAEIYR